LPPALLFSPAGDYSPPVPLFSPAETYVPLPSG